jgi:hypothetical protein
MVVMKSVILFFAAFVVRAYMTLTVITHPKLEELKPKKAWVKPVIIASTLVALLIPQY